MIYIIIEILLTAALIVIISEIAKFNDRLGGLISALPITTLFVITWLCSKMFHIKFLII